MTQTGRRLDRKRYTASHLSDLEQDMNILSCRIKLSRSSVQQANCQSLQRSLSSSWKIWTTLNSRKQCVTLHLAISVYLDLTLYVSYITALSSCRLAQVSKNYSHRLTVTYIEACIIQSGQYVLHERDCSSFARYSRAPSSS